MERYIRTQSSPPQQTPIPSNPNHGNPLPQNPMQGNMMQNPGHVQGHPMTPNPTYVNQMARMQGGGMKKVPSNVSLERVISPEKMVALQSK